MRHHKTFPCVRRDARRKERRGGAVDRAVAATGHLMQCAQRQSPSRQMPVDRLDAEGQHCPPVASRALKPPDALAKLLDTGAGDGCIHDLGNGLGGLDVLYLFSYRQREVKWSLRKGWRLAIFIRASVRVGGAPSPVPVSKTTARSQADAPLFPWAGVVRASRGSDAQGPRDCRWRRRRTCSG